MVRSGSLLTLPRIAKVGALVGFALWAMVAAGCAGAEPPPFVGKPSKGSGGAGGEQGLGGAAGDGSGGKSSASCKEGSQKECTIYVQQANGVTSCWSGNRFCVDGAWTECLDSGSAPTTQGER